MRPRPIAPRHGGFDGPRLPPSQTAWQQEVRDRLRLRRKRRVAGGDLPLFGPLALVEEPPSPAVLGDLDLPDLPLHYVAPPVVVPLGDGPASARPASPAGSPAPFSIERPSGLMSLGEPVERGLAVASVVDAGAERVARWHERLGAGLVDTGLLAGLLIVVAYPTHRIAPVSPDMGERGLWLLGFAGLLAAFYAGCFTGTTGQTPGKMLQELRVVDEAGRAPGFVRALGRAILGAAGVALLGAGALPAAFDPANRALHDRVFRTRVIRK